MNMELDGKCVLVEIDTAASLSLMSESMFWQVWLQRTLKPSTVQLKTYTGESVNALRTTDVLVRRHRNQALLGEVS